MSPSRRILSVLGCLVFGLASTLPAAAGLRTIETRNATLRLAEDSGDLVGVDWKQPALRVIAEPRLGENFRLLLPKPGYEAAYFHSREQKVSRIEATDNGVVCHYRSLRNSQDELPVSVRYEIRATGRQLHFTIEVDNPTERPLAEVLYGLLGGLQGVGDRLQTQTLVPGNMTNLAPALFTRFQGGYYGGGNLGIRHDAAAFLYPGAMTMGWMDASNPRTGVGYYYANQDPETRLTGLYFEMRPFTKTAVVQDNWPQAKDLPDGEPVGLTMGWLNLPYVRQGSFRAGPVALEVHRGDWHAASEIYRAWFDEHFPMKQRPATWLSREMAWQSIILSNGEDVIVHRFRDLPRLAADAKKYGVTTFEILGWDMGGIDRGFPDYRPDPRLGTPEEFRQALADIRKLGVHPLLFANVQVADTATELFRSELSRYAVHGRWAPDLPLYGWGEGTISARLGLTRSNMTVVSPGHPGLRKFLLDRYEQMIRDGAEGIQLDKTNIMGLLDFNPSLPTSPDRSLAGGMASILQELHAKARQIQPDFGLASELWTDRLLPFLDASYTRLGTLDMPSTALRYTFPEWKPTIFGESPGDFSPMNNGMRYGMIWALAPRHYNDSLDDPLERPLARYVADLIRIRQKHRDVLFEGRFRDQFGASVQSGPHVRYSTFEGAGGARACVVVNYGDEPQTAQVSIDGAAGREATVSAPFEVDRTARMPVTLKLPPQRCAVVVIR